MKFSREFHVISVISYCPSNSIFYKSLLYSRLQKPLIFREITAKDCIFEKNRKIAPVFCQNIQHFLPSMESLPFFAITKTYASHRVTETQS